MTGKISFGGTLIRSWQVVTQRPLLFLGLSFLPVLGGLLFVVAAFFIARTVPAYAFELSALIMMAAVILVFCFEYVIQGACSHAILQMRRGEVPSFWRSLGTCMRRFFPLFSVAFIVAFPAFVGLLLYILPSLAIATLFAVAAPTCMIEQRGVFSSLVRAVKLVAGSWLQVAGLLLLIGVGYWGFGKIVAQVVDSSSGEFAAVIVHFALAISAMIVGGTCFNVVLSVIYFELRAAEEAEAKAWAEQS